MTKLDSMINELFPIREGLAPGAIYYLDSYGYIAILEGGPYRDRLISVSSVGNPEPQSGDRLCVWREGPFIAYPVYEFWTYLINIKNYPQILEYVDHRGSSGRRYSSGAIANSFTDTHTNNILGLIEDAHYLGIDFEETPLRVDCHWRSWDRFPNTRAEKIDEGYGPTYRCSLSYASII